MAVQIALFLLSLSLAISPGVPLPVDPDSSSNNVVIVANDFPPPLPEDRGFWDNDVNTVDTDAAELPCVPGETGCDSAPSSRPKRSIIGLSRRRHNFFFRQWTVKNKAPNFLHRGMVVAHVDDRLRAPFRITCLPARDPDGSNALLTYSMTSLYAIDQAVFAIGHNSGCVYVVRNLARWPNLHPLRVCVQDSGRPGLQTCTTLLVILYSGGAPTLSTPGPLPEDSDATTASTDESVNLTSDAASVDEVTAGPHTTVVPVPDSTNALNSSTDSNTITENTTTPTASVSPMNGDLTTTDTDEAVSPMNGDLTTTATDEAVSPMNGDLTTTDTDEAVSSMNGDLTTTATDEAETTSDFVTPYVPIVATARSYSTTTDSAGSPQPDPTGETSSSEPPVVTTEQSTSASSNTTKNNDTASEGSSDPSTASPGSTTSDSSGDITSSLSQEQTTTEKVEVTSTSQSIAVESDVTVEPQTSSPMPAAPTLRFDKAIYEVSILEESPINTRVPVPARMSLLDPSSGVLIEPITFSLVSPGPESAFAVDPSDATLSTTKIIDREQTPQFKFFIKATTPSGLTATAEVIVKVIDVNDNAPRFDVEDYVVNVTSDVEEGAALATVEARDADEGQNAEVTYLLHGDNSSLFSLDPSTGVLALAARLPVQSLDYSLNLTVLAVDSMIPQQQTSLPLTVAVFPPALKFTLPGPAYLVPAGLPAGTQIGTVEAIDEKTGNSSAVTYSLLTSHSDLMFPFTIDPQTGDLLTSAPLPRGQNYDLSVEARVNDDPPRSVVTPVTVVVESPQ